MIKLGKNQYLFTKEACENIIVYDKSIEFKDYRLYIGEECKITIKNSKDIKLIVIGYAVDVLNTDNTLEGMLDDLMKKISMNEIGPKSTANWCGRWVIIAFVKDDVMCWHDACGLKQVFYDNKKDTIASQARYISNLWGYKQTTEALEYMELAKKADDEYCLPIDETMYSEIKRLLPNHILNMADKTVRRAGLNIYSQGYDEAVNKCSKSICNAMKAAANQYKLFITLTAGWDSRIVLSACNNINQNYDIITFKYDWMKDENEDIVVASKLCKQLNLEHKVLLCKDCDDDFSVKYCEHSENPHRYWIQMSRTIEEYGEGILVKGSCNEILRMTSGKLYNWQITPKVLCKMFGIPITKFSIAAVKRWLASAIIFCKQNHLSVLDLFYWEHRMGSWLAECNNENDVVGEIFTPFNSREYLENGLSVSNNKRGAATQCFIIAILKKNWKTQHTEEWTRFNKTLSYAVKTIIKNKMSLIYGIYVLIRYSTRRAEKIND